MVLIQLKQSLSDFLKGCSRLLILTVGNEMRSDDGFGPYLASIISRDVMERGHLLINAGTVPENFTGMIRSEKPSHIIIVDAVEMGKEPGTIMLIDRDRISDYSISTHAMPLSFLVRYLEEQGDCRITLIGVQPENLEFGMELSEGVRGAAYELRDLLLSAIDEVCCGKTPYFKQDPGS
ncbi:hydrogenase maturation peptidase HycI [Methanothermobacter sp. KEPCO-1]|uniref:hydrogenase maturation peptidase HycI n=1 Tax=Methanothermobacter TaxID=145260 RepID=UPI0011C8B422|nr:MULTISPECIES: hydrogenase maturation peptidase HycI [Methanothermobacter]QEF95068.1 hydrogenase maturation peptidase HycI [Methanothermobacter sp. KEPCO-1]WBF09293.1 hydrogenase maturation peptidase HycI [Methanothermobacter marburgensis]